MNLSIGQITLLLSAATFIVAAATLFHGLYTRRRKLIIECNIRENRKNNPPDLDLSVTATNAGRPISIWLVCGGFRKGKQKIKHGIGNFPGQGGAQLGRDEKISTVISAHNFFRAEGNEFYCIEELWLEDSHRRKYRIPNSKKKLQRIYKLLCEEPGYERYRRKRSKPVNWEGEWSCPQT